LARRSSARQSKGKRPALGGLDVVDQFFLNRGRHTVARQARNRDGPATLRRLQSNPGASSFLISIIIVPPKGFLIGTICGSARKS
jgi:hypothetical protein